MINGKKSVTENLKKWSLWTFVGSFFSIIVYGIIVELLVRVFISPEIIESHNVYSFDLLYPPFLLGLGFVGIILYTMGGLLFITAKVVEGIKRK